VRLPAFFCGGQQDFLQDLAIFSVWGEVRRIFDAVLVENAPAPRACHTPPARHRQAFEPPTCESVNQKVANWQPFGYPMKTSGLGA
jgi:hypothetical protein